MVPVCLIFWEFHWLCPIWYINPVANFGIHPLDAVEEPIGTVEDHEDGDFIDDDFGLSIKREWEHLRQQQLRIEEEISNIQKEAVPLVEKPPPPYTPPALGTIHILRKHLYSTKLNLTSKQTCVKS